MRRFDPAYVDLKARLDALGAPVLAHCAHRNPTVPTSFDTEMILTDSLVHDVDAARWLLGQEFTEVTVLAPQPSSLAPAGVLDPLIVLLRTDAGAHVDVECFVNAQYGYDIRCEVVGSDAVARLDLIDRASHPRSVADTGGRIAPALSAGCTLGAQWVHGAHGLPHFRL